MNQSKTKKVLIALDFNPTAQKVAEEGFSIAKAMDAQIFLLHVVSDPVYYSSMEYSPVMGFNGFIQTGTLQLDNVNFLKNAAFQFLEKSKNHLGDESIETLVEEGDFAESILETAKKIKADIIILGTHSRKWLENIIMGSVTEQVLRHSQVPLFIIPTKKRN